MTQAEKLFIIRNIENLIEQEKRVCKQYIELNPCDADRRKRDAELVIYAYTRVLSTLTE